MTMLYVLVLFGMSWYGMIYATASIPIDNGVIGTSVQCAAESIAVNFTTRNPFTGRVFVQGMSDRPECVRNYGDGAPAEPAPVITFEFGECNMQRTRTLAPQPGMLQTIIVVISFHKVFITKVDRAYKIQCFYMESEKTVTSHLDVSMLTTDTLRQTSVMPTCSYVVRRGSRSGDIVRYAKVGEPVFHEWECDSDQVKILVKNCFADDGQGNRQQILDDKGCALDPVILSDLTYDSSGNAKASVESHVFKYADKTTVFFQCTVQICTKGEPQCEQSSPPRCTPNQITQPGITVTPSTAAGGIRKRAAEILSDDNALPGTTFDEVDLLTDPIAVLDLVDASVPSKLIDATGSRHPLSSIKEKSDESLFSQSQGHVCMSTTGFSVLIVAILLLFVGIVVSAALMCLSKHCITGA